MGYSHWPLRYFPPTIKPKLEPDMLWPIRGSLAEQKELEDLRADFSKYTQHLGMRLVEAQNLYIEDCAKKLGISVEELAENYELESRMKDPVLGNPRPVESNDYKITYEFRLVPRVDRG